MSQGRSICATIFKNFINSMRPKKYWGECIGRDHFGTEYYEIPPEMQPNRLRNSRWFVPAVKDKFDQEIPPEWQAWLRYKRRDPPTQEEIDYNLAQMNMRIENAKKLEAPKSKPKEVVTASDKRFPRYEEYTCLEEADIERRKKPF